MKYIITESKFESLFIKYLNRYDWKVWEYSDNEISVYDGYPGKRIFYTEQYNDPNESNEEEFTLIISLTFAEELQLMFGELFDPWKLVKWFNEKFNSNCVTFSFYNFDLDD